MAKVILTMQYEIDEKKREEFLGTVKELQSHYKANPHISYLVCEQKGKKNAFVEMYIAESEEAYAQFKESEDQAADNISEKLSAYMKNGKAKYTTYVESL
jgi:quinol monooxygenase YgiN